MKLPSAVEFGGLSAEGQEAVLRCGCPPEALRSEPLGAGKRQRMGIKLKRIANLMLLKLLLYMALKGEGIQVSARCDFVVSWKQP